MDCDGEYLGKFYYLYYAFRGLFVTILAVANLLWVLVDGHKSCYDQKKLLKLSLGLKLLCWLYWQ